MVSHCFPVFIPFHLPNPKHAGEASTSHVVEVTDEEEFPEIPSTDDSETEVEVTPPEFYLEWIPDTEEDKDEATTSQVQEATTSKVEEVKDHDDVELVEASQGNAEPEEWGDDDNFPYVNPMVIVPYPGRRMRDVNFDAPVGFELALRENPDYTYTAIEVEDFDPWYEPPRPFFPTQWIAITNPYWEQVQTVPELYRDGQYYETLNLLDGCIIGYQAFPSGRIVATRNGVRVVVAYEDQGTGGRYQPEPLKKSFRKTHRLPVRKKGVLIRYGFPGSAHIGVSLSADW